MKISRVVVLGTLAFIALVPPPVAAQEMAPAACVMPVAPTDELASWADPVPLAAENSEGRTGRARLAIGQAAHLTLLKTPEVRYPLRPEKPGESGSFGGLVRLDVRKAGTYRVALGSAAWIDLVRGRQAVTSIVHGHGPDCTGIRKIVDFPLTPGRYTLQIAATDEPQMTVLVVRLP
ncbi:hypothetical protein [Croceicoccus estronivorus]|uniref:hypothetical protein n=1 Tax=Croceicoccus estronivorus TaxID=1172626 RepID=UPI001F30051E|nr:hypothetical protein [Croceicoccus estronivorus]